MVTTTAAVEVVGAGPDDAETLAALQWRWRVEEWSGHPVVDRVGFTEALRAWLAEHATSYLPFLARVDGSVAGMAWLGAIDSVPTPPQLRRLRGHVQSVYVVPELRDRGVGSALLLRLIDEARSRGFEYLLVHPSERAFPFYRRHGFSGSGDFLALRLKAETTGPD